MQLFAERTYLHGFWSPNKNLYTIELYNKNTKWFLPSTLTSMSSNRPPTWLMVSEFGESTGPGPLSDTCGPAMPPFDIGTVIGQPGTDTLLNETLMMWSQVSAGTNDTVNLCGEGDGKQNNNESLLALYETYLGLVFSATTTYLAFPCGCTWVGILWPFAEIVISKFPSPASPASTVNWTFRPTTPLLTDPTTTFVASYDLAMKGVPYLKYTMDRNK